jgi:hypothetical protein
VACLRHNPGDFRNAIVDRCGPLALVANGIFNIFQLMFGMRARLHLPYPGPGLISGYSSHRGIRKNHGGTFRDLDIAVIGLYCLLASNVLDSYWRVDPFHDLQRTRARRFRASGNLCHRWNIPVLKQSLN